MYHFNFFLIDEYDDYFIIEEEVEQNDDMNSDEHLEDEETLEEYEVNQIEQKNDPVDKVKQIEQKNDPVDKVKQIEQTNNPVKSTVTENETLPEECDAEVLEDELWKKEDENQLPHSIERPKKVSRFKAARLQGKFSDT
ncbi:5416_t:CDS:2 [Dentiscutata erythropus]|uniref:5416_t:CDS:1 n=1 Tax=Dentiscutata erythropus TaxID=1348616 RepID=A0A9N9GWU4_9GLOM|nr:5416_t:CDS:2 [Dentiscutata erythropus]